MVTLAGAELRLLAIRRVQRGEYLLRHHQTDGVGCCRCCGRVYPCDGHRLGEALVAHYRRLADPDEAVCASAMRDSAMSPPRMLAQLRRWLVHHARI